MKMERGWFLAIAVVLISLVAASDACAQGLRVRWDIISLTNFNPITIVAGGQASALANDGSRRSGRISAPGRICLTPTS